MFHPAIAAALAHERQTQMIKSADRRRAQRAAKVAGAHDDRNSAGRRGR